MTINDIRSIPSYGKTEDISWPSRFSAVEDQGGMIGGVLTDAVFLGDHLDHHLVMAPHGWDTAVGNACWVEYITPGQYLETIPLETTKLVENGRLKIPDGVAKISKGQQHTPSCTQS